MPDSELLQKIQTMLGVIEYRLNDIDGSHKVTQSDLKEVTSKLAEVRGELKIMQQQMSKTDVHVTQTQNEISGGQVNQGNVKADQDNG